MARLLANSHRTKTIEKEDRDSAKNAASNIPQTIMRLYWNGQLLQRYVATVVPMEITFINNGGNIFILYEFIDYMNSYII